MSERRDSYPPRGHLIRHLRMELELGSADTLHGTMPILDDFRDAGGALRTGALATFVDVAAGTYSHEMVRPDWLATTDMKLHLVRPAVGLEVSCETTTVRAGRRNILSMTVVTDQDGEVARGWVTYARLPRRDDSPVVEDGSRIGRRLVYAEPPDLGTEIDRPDLDDYLGIRIIDGELAVELEHHPRIHNSFGSLQGGAAAAVAERVAMLASERHFAMPSRVTDFHMYYLGQSRSGPFRAEAEVLRCDDASVTVEVGIFDAGNNKSLLDVATLIVAPIAPVD